ncbi:ISL3 family transposase [Methylobacterium sp. CCH5-D2]|uniref:ISL3 family transposase n=1 Tax=Methylobacterium sp. CCH5-D2 TaxID=1768765 RepID=UPI0009E6E297|nr:ISL3 family transposase [Methylobacterium sp. CCH5-D2]
MTDLLRLPNLAAVDTYEEGGFLIVRAASKKPLLPFGCCLWNDKSKNGTKAVRFRDHAIQGQPVWLEVSRQRYRCNKCHKISYEELPDIDTERRITLRFKKHLERQAVEHSFTTAAKVNGVHETLIRRLFDDYSDRMLKGYIPKLPRVLGMDEIYLHRRARFVIGDVERGLMIDMQPSRREVDLRDYFHMMAGREEVEIVCQDMWSGYRKLTQAVFPKAVTVVDKYHVQRTANYGMEVVRKALYRDLSNKDRIALKRRRAVFLARWDTCKPETQTTLSRLFGLYPVLATAYDLKERFYDIYEAESRAAAEHATNQWLASVPPEFERPFKPSIDAFKLWRPHILRYFEHRFTSGYVERLNGLIRRMNVNGAGYTFDVLRKKAILKHGEFGKAQFGEWAHIGRYGKGVPIMQKVWLGAPLSTLEADLEAGTF